MSACPRCLAPASGWQCGTCGVDLSDLAHTCPRHGETMPCWECDVEVEIAVQDAQEGYR